jgi:hypothetical protein
MNQVENSTITQPVPLEHHRLLAGAAVVVAAITLSVTAALAIVSAPARTLTVQPTQREDAVDGWAPAMAERSAAKLARTQDGYLPGLLGARHTQDAVDGWASSLIR